MNTYLEYTDDEIYALLQQIKANEQSATADDTPPAEPSAESSARRSDAGVMRELSIEEILKKMETEIGDSNST